MIYTFRILRIVHLLLLQLKQLLILVNSCVVFLFSLHVVCEEEVGNVMIQGLGSPPLFDMVTAFSAFLGEGCSGHFYALQLVGLTCRFGKEELVFWVELARKTISIVSLIVLL